MHGTTFVVFKWCVITNTKYRWPHPLCLNDGQCGLLHSGETSSSSASSRCNPSFTSTVLGLAQDLPLTIVQQQSTACSLCVCLVQSLVTLGKVVCFNTDQLCQPLFPCPFWHFYFLTSSYAKTPSRCQTNAYRLLSSFNSWPHIRSMLLTSLRFGHLVCVCWLFIFKDTEPSPLQDSLSHGSTTPFSRIIVEADMFPDLTFDHVPSLAPALYFFISRCFP